MNLLILIFLLLISEVYTDDDTEEKGIVYGLKHFCENHPFTYDGVYSQGKKGILPTCTLTFKYEANGITSKMKRLCGFMGPFEQDGEPVATETNVTCKYVSYGTCAPLLGNDRPHLIRDHCLLWSKNTKNPKELPSCPPGYSIPRSENLKLLYFVPYIMDVPQSVYVDAKVTAGESSTTFDNDYCNHGWAKYEAKGEEIRCLKAFKFSELNNRSFTKTFSGVNDVCIGNHGRLALLKTRKKIWFAVNEFLTSENVSLIIGGYDLNFEIFHRRNTRYNYIWLDGTMIMKDVATLLGGKKDTGNLALGAEIQDASFDSPTVVGFLCERPGNLRIAPSAAELHNDDYWRSKFGKIIRVDKAYKPGMFCVRPAYAGEHEKISQMSPFCEFLKDMGHPALMHDGMCHLMTNVLVEWNNVNVMHETCQELHDTKEADAHFLNMNTYTREVAIRKLLEVAKEKFNKTGLTEDLFLMQSTMTTNLKKKLNNSCTTYQSKKDMEFELDAIKNYFFHPHFMRHYAPHWRNLATWEYQQKKYFSVRKMSKLETTAKLYGADSELIPSTMWRNNANGRSNDFTWDWPKNDCNDGIYSRLAVVAGSKGLQDVPYYFRAPIGCSFGVRQQSVEAYCDEGWSMFVRETGDAVCNKAVMVPQDWLNSHSQTVKREEALEECRKDNATLASLKSYEEENRIIKLANDVTWHRAIKWGHWFWIGTRNDKSAYNPKNFHWIEDNEPVGYNRFQTFPYYKYREGDISNYSVTKNCAAVRNNYWKTSAGGFSDEDNLMMWHNQGCDYDVQHYNENQLYSGYICTKKAKFIKEF